MRHFVIAVLLLVGMSTVMAGEDGLVTKKSKFSAAETLDRLEKVLREKGIIIVARVSHQKNATGVGIDLRPTELLIFGNPKLGSQFFTSNQTAGLDLPLKALAWEDEKGQVWLSYNDPAYIAKRHHIADRGEVVEKMNAALGKFSDLAIGAN